MTHPLRVGMAGAGWVTQHHLAAWAGLADEARVVAIADPNAAAGRARTAAFGIDRTFTSVADMLANTELDALDVASPREFHAEAVRMAAARGIAVLCQKPLAPTLAEARQLVADVGDRCRLMVHENWRFRPYYRDMARSVQEGRIGEVEQAQMTLLTSGLLPDGNGDHLDTLRFLLGELALRYARLGHASPAMRGEDRAFLALETRNGAPVSMVANLVVHGAPPAMVDRLTLIGTRGTLVLDDGVLSCRGVAPFETAYDMPACYAQSYAGAIGHFVDRLRTGAPFETAPDDNLRTLALVEAVYVTGRPG